MNEYYLYFSFEKLILNHIVRFERLTNSKDNQEVKIGLMTVEQWYAMSQGLLNIVVKTSINKIMEDGNAAEVMNRLNRKKRY